MLVQHSCPALCDPVDCSWPGSSVQGILRQEYWNGLPLPSPGDLLNPGIEPGLMHWQVDSLPTTNVTWEGPLVRILIPFVRAPHW